MLLHYPSFLKRRAIQRRLRREFPGRELLTHRIGAGAKIGAGCYIGPDAELGERAELGDHSYVNRGTIFMSGKIGKFCSIGYYCQIGMQKHPLTYVSTSSKIYGSWSVLSGDPAGRFDEFPDPPVIGNDVWIGSNAHILQGVSIGHGAVVGAGSVVTKDVDPYSIVGGVPARTIRKRFDDDTIALLLDWRWWEMSVQELDEWREVLWAQNWQARLKERMNRPATSAVTGAVQVV